MPERRIDMSNFMDEKEIVAAGFKNVGENVFISRQASFYNISEIEIGDNVRIDDFCILSGKIKIGSYVHVAAHTCLFAGTTGIEFGNYSGISSHSSVYAESDDYSGETMTNPMIPDEFRNVIRKKVIIGEHVLVGSHSVILPGSVINRGSAVGSMSLVKSELEEWGIYVGVPCKKIKDRSRLLENYQRSFEQEVKNYVP